MKTTYLYFLAVILAALIVAMLAYIANTRAGRIRVVAKPLMTPTERATFDFLQDAVPHLRVHAQVAMGALLRPEPGMSRKDSMSLRNRFAQKIVDYVLEEPDSGRVVALVELDDRTHDIARDRKRDAITAAAGYLTIRLPARERPTRQSVRERVTEALAPRPAPNDRPAARAIA